MSSTNNNAIFNEVILGEEAAEWLLLLDDADARDAAQFSEAARNQAFYEWIGTSPDHLRVFLETMEMHIRMSLLDSHHMIKVEALLQQRADVIPLRKDEVRREVWSGQKDGSAESLREIRSALEGFSPRRHLFWRIAAAAVLVCAVSFAGYWWYADQNIYLTKLGEQRSTKLEDGSFIYLNTDSKVEVDFSAQTRNVRLLRGEALFVVERDSARPFIVSTGSAAVRALGTQFNVRRHSTSADVAVVEGAVQVTALDSQAGFPAQRLVAGEQVRVLKDRIASPDRHAVAEAVAWRQRRLVFHDARLADVAAEFNRYNRTKIRIEGDAVKDVLLSGIFDADRPQALMLYAAKSAAFAVEPEGNDWVVRGR